MSKERYKDLVLFRVKVAGILYTLAILLFIGRLANIQFVNNEQYINYGISQQQKDEKIIPKRGIITDRNGKILADSIVTYELLVEKKYVREANNEEQIADVFETVLEIPKEKFFAKMNDDSARFTITKKATQEQVDRIKEEIDNGLRYDPSSAREYPYGQLASHIIGYVSNDNEGVGGIEAYFDKELRGVYGRRVVIRDAQNREVPESEVRYSEAIDGYKVVLTIDEVIQGYVEKVLDQALVDSNAVGVTAIVMNAKNGEILAMASKPDFNPNDPRKPLYPETKKAYDKAQTQEEKSAVLNQLWRNPAASNSYEPGSTFKVITAATALEKNLVRANETFYDAGYLQVQDRTIKNWTSVPYGTVDFRKATVESINTIYVQVGKRIGGEEFLKYVDAFGFGRRTGIEVPAEADGIVYSKQNLRDVELATMSFGQGISITPIQLVSAVGAIANDGKLIKPTLVKEISNSKGEVIRRSEIEVVRNPISADTANKTMDIMKSVGDVSERGKIEGYSVAGKSGTAQKPKKGGGYEGYIASFIGVVPADNPELIVLAIIDNPRQGSHFGGVIATPVVKKIMEYSLRRLEITPDLEDNSYSTEKVTVPEIRNLTFGETKNLLQSKNLKYKLAVTLEVDDNSIVVDSFPKPGEKIKQGTEVVLYVKNNNFEVEVPDLVGKTQDEANRILDALGLKSAFNGTGKVVGQSPNVGEKIATGSLVSLDLKE